MDRLPFNVEGKVITILLQLPMLAGIFWLSFESPLVSASNTQFQANGEVIEETTIGASEEKRENVADSARRNLVRGTNTIARWADAFFDDPDYEAEEADSRVSLRQAVTFSENESTEFRTRVSAKIRLANAAKRMSYVFEGNDDISILDRDEEGLDQSLEKSVDHPSIGVQYFQKDERRLHTSFSAGLRFGNPSIYLGPRVRYQHTLGNRWLGRYAQRTRWYTNDGWESITDVNFDGQFNAGSLFRQDLRVTWREDRHASEGIRSNVTTSYTRYLSEDAAISYAWSSAYFTRPKSEWRSSELSVRYRRKFLRDWLFVEVVPFVSFEQRFAWHENPGMRIELEIVFEDDEVTPTPRLSR